MGVLMKKIAILGSTGSIGTQALEVIRENSNWFKVSALTAGKNVELLMEQIKEFNPEIVAVAQEKDAIELKAKVKNVEVLWGIEGITCAASDSGGNMVLNALVGMMGLLPTYHSIKSGKDIALANKETLVAGGSVIMQAVDDYNVQMLPVDSEHSAVFQCLQGNKPENMKKIILTASGGPFRGYSLEGLKSVTADDALKHPNWNMGSKITIDSATLMNKGLEVIEASWLFNAPWDQIDVIVHPQSLIHSMVEYMDGSIIAQLGMPDMRVPIQYAFSFPNRLSNHFEPLDFNSISSLAFEKPNKEVFKCLQLAYDAIKEGGSYPVVLNAANEVLVHLFLEKKIKFLDIQNNISKIIEAHTPVYDLNLDAILEIDKEIREKVLKECS